MNTLFRAPLLRERVACMLTPARQKERDRRLAAANLRAKDLDFGGFDTCRLSVSRAGFPRSIGNFLEIQTQRFLVYTT